jgi:type IV secretion system protein VirD4
MLGSETLIYDDTLRQEEARRHKRQAMQRLFLGDDPFAAVFDAAHYGRAAETRAKQARSLLGPDEVLSLPEDRQILFISGKNLKPVLANKYPYFTRAEMAGLYLPNPYHPPADRVLIATRFGSKWADIIREKVPPSQTKFPQHQSGCRSYVKGYQTF